MVEIQERNHLGKFFVALDGFKLLMDDSISGSA